MPVEVSVLIIADRQPSQLAPLITSLDTQTMRPAQFEIVLVSTDDARSDRLEALAAQRPNVTLLRSAGPAEAALVQAFAAANGTWTLILGNDATARNVRLLPEGLERLVRYAQDQDQELDWLAARSSHRNPKGRLTGVFVETERRSGGPVPPSPCILHRTARLREAGAETGAGDRGGVYADYPCLVLDADPAAPEAEPRVTVAEATGAWQGSRLEVAVTLTESSGDTTRCSIQHRTTGLEYWLPTKVDGSVVRAEIDLGSPSYPKPDEGPWELWLTVIDGDGAGEKVRVPKLPVPSAVVGGVLVAAGTTGDGFTLDLGAAQLPAIGELPAARASIVEAADGTLGTLPVPALHVDGDARIGGQLLQAGFPLPAELVATDGEARIECLLSGIPGSNPLLTRFGTSKASPTGLSLSIGAVGEMTIHPTPVKPAKPAPKPAPKPTPKPAAKPAPTPSAQANGKKANGKKKVKPKPTALTKMRRRVPGFLEPAVRGISRNSAARSIYGKINRALR